MHISCGYTHLYQYQPMQRRRQCRTVDLIICIFPNPSPYMTIMMGFDAESQIFLGYESKSSDNYPSHSSSFANRDIVHTWTSCFGTHRIDALIRNNHHFYLTTSAEIIDESQLNRHLVTLFSQILVPPTPFFFTPAFVSPSICVINIVLLTISSYRHCADIDLFFLFLSILLFLPFWQTFCIQCCVQHFSYIHQQQYKKHVNDYADDDNDDDDGCLLRGERIKSPCVLATLFLRRNFFFAIRLLSAHSTALV